MNLGLLGPSAGPNSHTSHWPPGFSRPKLPPAEVAEAMKSSCNTKEALDPATQLGRSLRKAALPLQYSCGNLYGQRGAWQLQYMGLQNGHDWWLTLSFQDQLKQNTNGIWLQRRSPSENESHLCIHIPDPGDERKEHIPETQCVIYQWAGQR